MKHPEQWDWDSPRKEIPFASWQSQFKWVEEPQVSPDGESVAAIVNAGEGEFNVCINGATWETPFEKIWHLRFAPDGRLTAIVSDSGSGRLPSTGSHGKIASATSGSPVSARTERPSPSSSSRTCATAWP